MRKGIEFENKIFKNIEFMNEQYKKLYGYQAVFINKFQNNIIPTILNKEYLINLTKILKSNEALLIEHQYEIPRIYQTINFGLTMSDARPDIIRIIPLKKLKDQKIQILNEKGQHIFIEPEAYQNVYGINIFDIKAVDKERVGVKFYGEIHYYLQTFNSFIFENNLQNQFVVLIENNGIIPYDPNPGYVNIDSLVELSIKIDFIATRGLYDNFISLIKELRQQIPIARENISTNLGAHCEKCDFREDCQRTKGIIYEEVTKNDYTEYVLKWDLSKASVDLIPSITPSTAQELKELARSENIQNVYNVIRNMGLSTYPRPLNSELPVLKNKVKSILNQGEVIATENEIFSSSIPKYQTNTISITLETDSTTNFAFAFGMFLDSTMGINSKSEVKDVYGNWWRIWKSYLIKADGKYSSDLIDEIFNELENEVNLEISKSDVIAFAKALHSFENESVNDQKSLSVYTTNDIYKRGKIERKLDKIIARLRIEYVNINYRDTVEGEQVFVFQIIKMIANLLKIVVIMEKYITVEINERIYSVSTAVYYWSQEIVEKLRDIISNHMLEIVKDNALLNDFLLINSWITPSNMVSDPYQLKKVFDLSKFVTQTIGLPLQINYTWHRVAKELLSSFRRPNRRFWAELFNNMDRTQWLNFLQYRDIDQKRANKQFKQIQAQVYNKIFNIYLMVLHFQRNGDTRALISNNPDVKINKLSDSIRKLYPNNFSFIAKTWFTFSLLTERSQELTNIELRGMYPEYAIGKLEAAELDFESSTTVPAIGKQRKNRYQYRFSLKRESSNVKFKENDMVLIFPFSLRDSISAKQKYSWMFTIDRFELNSLTNTYFITTKPAIHNLTLKLQKEGIEKPRWFMYPFVMANWSSKLYKSKDSSNSLLQKNNLGYSWLADRISILWQLTEQSELELPEKLFFPSSHIYLFTPDLLNKINYNYENTTLLTNVFPKPDESQKNSILYALSGPLRLIQGPPGTGKSQTIVAIIDEFIQRSKYDKDKIRILVTAFSYPAIEVIVKKIADSKNEYGSPTDVASAQKLYISSDSRNPLVLDGDEMTYLIDNLQKKEGEKWLFNSTTELPNKTKSNSEEEKLEDKLEDTTIFFANAHQLYHMSKTKKGKPILSYNKIEFDLIILDEASQLPADYLTSILQTVINKEIELKFSKQINNETVTPDDLEHIIIVNPNDLKTHVVLVGDNNQLPPVQPIKPPKALKNILGSVFDYYREGFKLDMRQLLYNYRSHFLIIEHTNSLNIYDSLKPAPNSNNKNKLIEGNIDAINKGWTKEVLDPKKVLVALIHNYEYDTGLSRTEATVTVRLIIDYFRMLNPQTEDQQRKFWQNEIGIVAPHNAHGRYIINEISRELNDLNLNKLTGFELSSLLRNTIFSVEKFQGSERSMIIATIGVSAKDQLDKEEEFIYDRNRLNVLTTRAKYKMVLICSENFLNHVPNDLDRSFDVNMSKNFAYTFCDQNSSFKVDVGDKEQTIEFYYKEA